MIVSSSLRNSPYPVANRRASKAEETDPKDSVIFSRDNIKTVSETLMSAYPLAGAILHKEAIRARDFAGRENRRLDSINMVGAFTNVAAAFCLMGAVVDANLTAAKVCVGLMLGSAGLFGITQLLDNKPQEAQ